MPDEVAASNKVKLTNVRLSFPDLFEATQFEGGGTFSYGASFLIEPGSANDKAVQAEIARVGSLKWKAKSKAIVDSVSGNSQKNCYVSGDLKDYDGYEGKMSLSSKRYQDKGRPGVYNRDTTPLVAEDGVIYAGCYVNAFVEIWAQDNKWGKGIRCTLISVQFSSDGDAFSAGSKPEGGDYDDLATGEEEEDGGDLA